MSSHAIDVTPAVLAVLATNRGPDPTDPDRRILPDYGVRASVHATQLEIELTFRTGAAYCCMELGCHLGLQSADVWARLRAAFREVGVAAPPDLEARVVVIVEPGARFFDLGSPDPARPGWYAFETSAGQRYVAQRSEADATRRR